MEPYSITCGTCAARLKVTRESAIGQVLACPKCSNMVRVTPPPGWKPKQSTDQPDSSSDSLASGSFDDIDDVLAATGAGPAGTAPHKRPAVPRPPGKPSRAAATPQSKAPAVPQEAEATEAPLLPNEQWTTPEARARKQMLLIGGLAVAALVVIGTVVGAIVLNSGGPADPDNGAVASNNDAESDDSGSDSTAGNETAPDTGNDADEAGDGDLESQSSDTAGDPVPATSGADDNDAEANPADPETGQGTDSGEGDGNESSTSNNESAPGNVESDTGTEGADENSESSNPLEIAANGDQPDQDDESVNDNGPLNRNPLGGQNVLSNDILSPNTELAGPGELSALLAEANSSILEFQNIADAIRDEEAAGMPRYYIEKPDPKVVNIERQMNLNSPGMKYEDQPLIYALRDVSALLGLAFYVDVDSWQAAGIPFDAQINVHIENEPYAVAIEKLLEPHGLESAVRPDGIVVVRPAGSAAMSEKEYELPPIKDPADEDARDGQIAAIKQLVDPQSWVRELNVATIERTGDRVNVRQSAQGHYKIQVLFDKVRAIQDVMAGGAPADQVEVLKSVSTAALDYVNLPLSARYSYPTPIESLLTRIHRQSGVMILVDWDAVSREGWTPATLIPGEFEEATPIDAARELAASMELTIRVLDARTIELTSFDAAAQRSDLELFYCGDIFNGPLTEEHLIDLFNRTIGPQLNRTPGVKVDYDPELKSIISYAPQPLQRQIEAIISRLGKIGGRPAGNQAAVLPPEN